jgi:hypothetical protein
MADELAPEDQEVDETRQLKEAVARLGASLREESERLKDDTSGELPIPAAPRQRADPRIEEHAAQLASLVEVQQQVAERLEAQAGIDRERHEELQQLATRARAAAVVAAIIAVVALVLAIVALIRA